MLAKKQNFGCRGEQLPRGECEQLELQKPKREHDPIVTAGPNAEACPSGAALRELRRHRGLSQTDLAQLLRISQSRVSAWERGHDEVPRRLRRQLIDIMCNKKGVLDPLIRNMIKNDPHLSVHKPVMTDGFLDFKFLHIAPYPCIDFLEPVSQFIDQRVSHYFDLGWCKQTHPGRPMRDKLMFDVERDVTTNAQFGSRPIHRVRSHHLFLEFEGHNSLILARHTLCTQPTGKSAQLHDQLFLDELD
jgi:DNA-binding transcriptional regulator YiaG